MLRILIIIVAFVSTITVDAQNEIMGGCVRKDGTESGINATSRFPMYSVMKFPQALYVADFLTRNNIELDTEVIVRKEELLQDTWSPMLSTFEDQRSVTYSELLAALLEWFTAHHNDNEPLRYIWQLMAECQTGGDRLPAAVPNSAKVVHKTGTGYPLPSGLPSGICDVGIIILDNGQQLPIAVYITNPSSQSRISDVAKQLLE